MADDSDNERARISMTMTRQTKKWLNQTYPDALEVQEQLRMAVNDARQLRDE